MKKVLTGIIAFIVVLLVVLAVLPFLFKDKVKQVLDKQIEKNIAAKVIYKSEDVNLSVFRNFPNLSLTVNNLTVIGLDSFHRDTLAALPKFSMGLDLMSVVKGNELKIKSVQLQNPKIKLKVLKGGKANWDIFIPDTTAQPTADTDTSHFNMAIKGWKIENGTLAYEDLSISFSVKAQHVNHSGSGDFTKNVFDMQSQTTADGFTMNYAGINYLEKDRLDANVTLAMDLNKTQYTFKENQIRINDFPFGFAGSITMPAEAIDLDLTFKAAETNFKNILSLVPGMFTEKFKDIDTDGNMAFNGYVKGRFDEVLLPGFGINLQVTNGRFKYPDLPQAATNINVAIKIANADGNVNNTQIQINKFHLDLGKNPVDAKAIINGLEPMQVDGNVKANIDLAEITKVFPVEGMTLRGLLYVDGNAKGTYSKTQMPVVSARLNLANAFIKSKDFPAPIQNLTMASTISNTTGNTDDTRIVIDRFNMLLDGEPLEGRVTIQDIDKPAFDAKIKGVLDLTKITKIFPLEGMTLSGRIVADVATKGKMTDIDAGKYTNITSSGTMQVTNLNFVSKDLPQGMKIASAQTTFNNDKILVQHLNGNIGKSDVQVDGTISNYMGYLFSQNQALQGNMNLNSNRFDVNEWMVDEYSGEPTQSASEGVVAVPENIDFTLNTSVKQVLYSNLKLENLKGKVLLKDKIARLESVAFNTLGGKFVTTGSYNTQNLAHPLFSFGLDIDNLDFKAAYNAFNTVKALAPIAHLLDGQFSTNFNFTGELGQNMMPIYSTLTGKGVVEVVKAIVTNMQVLNRISQLTNFSEVKNFVVENRDFGAEIVGGNLVIKPFDINVKDIKMTIGGTNNIDGKIAYVTALDVPTGKVGDALTAKLTSFTGLKDIKGTDRITLNLNVGGTLTDPKVSLAGGSAKAQATDMVKNMVASKLEDAKTKLEIKKQSIQDSLRVELDKKRLETEARLKAELDAKQKQAEENLKNQARNKLNTILNNKTKKPAATEPAPAPEPSTKPDTAASK
ncbi:AsmA-like C-terminal region-containing protein [Adhaeribacter aquaticus]|uniref:AsmA-like C-terminal region-containing protein n=1 Tax=Adhaeribacter aquaticus TaxID=299567 RepID=UPI00041B3ADA|nr:AsmA-like C-terminal region-containing protein [Adhaeribacter aquaticus]